MSTEVEESFNDEELKMSQVEYDKGTTLIFFTPLAFKCIQRKSNETVKRRYTSIGEKYNMCFKMIKSDSKLVKTLLFSYGFLQCSSKNQNCNLFWTNTHVSSHILRSIKSWQRMNHFPRSFMITKKDTLYECIDRAAIQYGSWFDFIPEYFCTPLNESNREKLLKLCCDIELNLVPPFIVKPACSSRGRDITFLKSPNDLDYLDNNTKLLISRYLDRPFLVNRLKSDLRVYVLVTSFYPLIVYVYSDGLARFAVHEYDETNRRNFSDVNTHLTNYSLNKTSSYFVKNNDVCAENLGHKWTLGALLREMHKQGVDTSLLMVRIEDVIIKTLLSVQGSVAASCRKFNLHPKCCFELFGFDILVDEDLKPWLLEANLSPSLACDAPLDSILKTNLLCDTLNIASIPLVRAANMQNFCTSDETNEEMTNDIKDSELNGNLAYTHPISSSTTSLGSDSSLVMATPSCSNSNTNLLDLNTNHNGSDINIVKINGNGSELKKGEGCGDNSQQQSVSANENGKQHNKITNTGCCKQCGSLDLNSSNGVNCNRNYNCYSADCQNTDMINGVASNSNMRKRKLASARASKVRKAQLNHKPTFSASAVTPQYLARAKCHFDKLETESLRKGRFIRIFPRSFTWELYSAVLEDVGQEKWDEDLNRRLNKGERLDVSRRDIEMAHAQLIDAKNYPSQKDLSPVVCEVILKEALKEAEKYRKRMYNSDIKPYPSALPFVRMEARRRTKSQTNAEELRRTYLLNRKQQLAEQQHQEKQQQDDSALQKQLDMNGVAAGSVADDVKDYDSTCLPVAPTLSLSSNIVNGLKVVVNDCLVNDNGNGLFVFNKKVPKKVTDEDDITTNVTIVLNGSASKIASKNEDTKNGTSIHHNSKNNNKKYSDDVVDENFDVSSCQPLSEMNVDFVVKKTRDGSAIVLEKSANKVAMDDTRH